MNEVYINPSMTTESRQRRSLQSTLVVVGVIVVIAAGAYYFYTKRQASQQPTPNAKSATFIAADHANKLVASVGVESIYQKDLETEIASLPPIEDEQMTKTIAQKLVDDSLILQGGRDEKVASLAASVFNSPTKNYTQRIKLVGDVRQAIIGKSAGISGTVVGVYFINGQVGALGVDKSRQIAQETITKLHADVKAGKMTIDQAAEAIRNNSSLAQIDPAYKSNASFDFHVTKNAPITRDEKLNAALWSLPQAGVSDIFVGPARNQTTGEYIDVMFHFGQVKKKVEGNITSFDDWLEGLRKKYEVKYY